MYEQVFAYCERGLDTAFWAEPINAITNAAFLIAAVLALVQWMATPNGRTGVPELILVAVVAIIGIGSFLFHTFATVWASLADVIPIGIFMMAYMGYALRQYLNLPWWAVAIGLVVFFVTLAQASMMRCDGGPCLNGSVAYFPAFIAMALIGLVLAVKGHAAGGYLVSAAVVFAVSLTFRSLDQALCPYTRINGLDPIGLHFLWHVLNATLLFLLLSAAIRHGRQRA
ncbi:MAG: ceramidase domain-containing protein [Pseudomonadota bacterium]